MKIQKSIEQTQNNSNSLNHKASLKMLIELTTALYLQLLIIFLISLAHKFRGDGNQHFPSS